MNHVRKGNFQARSDFSDDEHLLLIFDALQFARTSDAKLLKNQKLDRPFVSLFPVLDEPVFNACQDELRMAYLDLVEKFVASSDMSYLLANEQYVLAYINLFRNMFDLVDFGSNDRLPDSFPSLLEKTEMLIDLTDDSSAVGIEARKLKHQMTNNISDSE